MALPAIVCLKSVYNNKYLRYRDEEVQTHGLVQFSSDKVLDPLAQFEVVAASIGGGLVHLKSRYTNKFLVRWSRDLNWITADAEKVNEDQTNWGCTLFKPSFIIDEGSSVGPKKARLMHVQLGHYASLWGTDAPFDSCLYAGSKDTDPDSRDLVTVIDWAYINKLPKSVAFKGDNGKYLGPFIDKGITFLQFAYDDPNDPKVAHEAITSSDGIIVIKSKYTGKFWRLSEDHDWIVTDIIELPGNNARAMFRANVIDIGVVALLNMSKTWYCKRYTAAGVRKNLLRAATQSVDAWSLLEVKDLDNK
ncbi:hypothetical protein KSS87_022487 [Heliosperma pusillum]|nr:hypothetical protein KSS87_011177 [Heliosperma pusillum]KAH9619607.1 hypothetical protein KSS87_022487 [Heliosperma pusillum]